MKTLLLLLLLAISVLQSESETNKCRLTENLDIPPKWLTMTSSCTQKMREQVTEELNAAMTYLAMGAHFSKDSVNRPGFAKYFFESASEEREHAIKIISYLLMRTDAAPYLNNLIGEVNKPQDSWGGGAAAIKDALKLEASVTEKIRSIITTCESSEDENDKVFNDYHLVDYLSGEFLEEQYKGQRELAGMLSTLQKMNAVQGDLGEYLFDKKLLNGEPL